MGGLTLPPLQPAQTDLFVAGAPAEAAADRTEVTREIIAKLDDASGGRASATESQSMQSRPGNPAGRMGGAPRGRMTGIGGLPADVPPPPPPEPAAKAQPAPAAPARPRAGISGLASMPDHDDEAPARREPEDAPVARTATAAAPPGRLGIGKLADMPEEAPADVVRSAGPAAPARGNGSASLSVLSEMPEEVPDDVRGRGAAAPPKGDISQAPREEGLVEETVRIKKLIYQSKPQDSPYRVFLVVRPDKTDFKLTTNSDQPLSVNERIVARGKWRVYKNERNLHANYIVPEVPHDTVGIVNWLKSGAVSGVGKTTAENLAHMFGDRLADVLSDPKELARAGLRDKVAEEIAKVYSANTMQVKLVHFLGGLGLGESGITKIIQRYGMVAKEVIEKNPWQLADTIDGVGFQTADNIGLRHGHKTNSPDRIKAGIRHVLRSSVQEGHCGLPPRVLLQDSARLLGLPREIVKHHVKAALEGAEAFYDRETNLAVLKSMRESEERLAENVARLLGGRGLQADDASVAIEEAEAKFGVRLDRSQRAAAVMALTSPVCIITGGPGTGKSTTMKVVVEALRSFGRNPVLAAPTGRAAKRLSEVSGVGASTCHRLLQFQAQLGGFAYNADNPFPEDWFVTDEFSMVDVRLADSFSQAIKDNAGWTIVGDVDQLPSVGAGQVLRDLIESGAVPVARLNVVHRQGKDSGIVTAAHNVNTGRHPCGDGEALDGFVVEPLHDPAEVVARIVELMRVELPAQGYDPAQDVQVLAPMRKRDLGVEMLNVALKDALNPVLDDGRSVTLAGRSFTVNDRVMHIRNDYKKGVYNGEVGTVIGINQTMREGRPVASGFKVDFSGDAVDYTSSDVSDIEQAWATTVHKSQGCEFPVVVMACHSMHTKMLNRNLLYTGITRAKGSCIVVGDDSVLEYAAKVTDATRRHTGLRRLVNLEWERLHPPAEPAAELPLDGADRPAASGSGAPRPETAAEPRTEPPAPADDDEAPEDRFAPGFPEETPSMHAP